MAALVATPSDRFPPPPCSTTRGGHEDGGTADLRWLADLPPGCGLLRRSWGIVAMAVAAVAKGVLTVLAVLRRRAGVVVVVSVVVSMLSLVVVVVFAKLRRGWCWC